MHVCKYPCQLSIWMSLYYINRIFIKIMYLCSLNSPSICVIVLEMFLKHVRSHLSSVFEAEMTSYILYNGYFCSRGSSNLIKPEGFMEDPRRIWSPYIVNSHYFFKFSVNVRFNIDSYWWNVLDYILSRGIMRWPVWIMFTIFTRHLNGIM